MWINEFKKNYLKEFIAPFKVEKDHDYIIDLGNKYSNLYNAVKLSGANKDTLSIIKKYTTDIIKSVKAYYNGKAYVAEEKIRELVQGCENSGFKKVNNVEAFQNYNERPKFYHARLGTFKTYKAKDMQHIPFDKREISKSYRFSLSGAPCYYLGNSSYCCWIEMRMPADYEFNVSPVYLDGTQIIFDLAVSLSDDINNDDDIYDWLRRVILMIACSYRVSQEDRNFKSEYIIPQIIMQVCRRLEIQGISYYSNRVESQFFAIEAVNLVLYATQDNNETDYSDICKNMKIGDAFNFAMYKQLSDEIKNAGTSNVSKNNDLFTILEYNGRHYSYSNTDFYRFDNFLFNDWEKHSLKM